MDASRKLHLFKETADTVLTYLGQFQADATAPYRREDAPDTNTDMRSVLVFHLWPVGDVAPSPEVAPSATHHIPSTRTSAKMAAPQMALRFFIHPTLLTKRLQIQKVFYINDFENPSDHGEHVPA